MNDEIIPDDDIEIDIVEDEALPGTEPATPAAKPKAAEPAPEGAEDLRRQIEDLRRQKAAEEAARIAAESRARAREQEAQGYRGQYETAQLSAVDQAIAAAKADAERLEREVVQANEEGDFKRGAKLAREMARAEARTQQFEDAKALYLRQRTQQPPQQQPQQSDPFEDAISGFSDQTKRWLRAHPECVQDQAQSHRAAAAHHQAVLSGLTPDTPEYFARVEETMGYRQKPAAPVAGVPAAPVASSASGVPRAPSPGKRVVPARIVQLAKEQGVPLKDWLREHDALTRAKTEGFPLF